MKRFFLLSLAVVLLGACSSDGDERPAYLDSHSLKSLEIPPQLTRPNNSEELKIPEPSAKALASLQTSGAVEGMVAPQFKGLVLKSDQGIYWLEVDQDADNLWVVLRDFWAHEGIDLDRDEPLLGLMETQWIKEYQVKADREAGFFKRVLSRFSPDIVDKFRFRVERAGKQSRIFVSHRGMQITVSGETSRWTQRVSDPALEKEILYRLSLFAGLSGQKADDLFLAYTPYQPRMKVVAGSENSFEITGRHELVWRRLQQAVNQLGATVVDAQETSGSMVIEISEEKIPQALLLEEEDSEVFDPFEEKPSNPVTDTKTPDVEVIKLNLVLQEKDGNSILVVTDAQGKAVADGFAYDAMQLLARLLK